MKTHSHIFLIASLCCVVLITIVLYLGFQTHTDTHIALKLLAKGQTIGLILGLSILFGACHNFGYTQFLASTLTKAKAGNHQHH